MRHASANAALTLLELERAPYCRQSSAKCAALCRGLAPSCVKYQVELNNVRQVAEGRVRYRSPKGACAGGRRRARAPWCSQSSESMGP